MMRKSVAITLALFVVQAARAQVTTESLLGEMADLAGLARFPDPSFRCAQFSSYDRASKSPDDPKGWFANADVGQYLRVEENNGRKEYVMMHVEGPGAIVRIWSANPAGVLRIYLDGQNTPAIEAPLKDFLGGTYPGIPKPIAAEASRGWNSYFPIPYARGCKVTSDADGFYYHVNYRAYPPGTPVQTFEPASLERLAPQIQRIAERLEAHPPLTGGGTKVMAELAPGQTHGVELTGPASISELALLVSAENRDAALRKTELRITFDDELTVDVPCGDFFGAGHGVNPYASLPMGVGADGLMWSRWPMPFERTARIELLNQGAQTVRVAGHVLTRGVVEAEHAMRFHATYHAAMDQPVRPMIDWNYLHARGRGVFVGAAFAVANPVKAWWGEGDEKIYVDGEAFPSHFGTGTEDYFGYAWCSPELFQHAYHNQPRCDGPGNYGDTAVNRWHILDRIPFEREFRFDMELWHWAGAARVHMSVVTYWYGAPGAKADARPLTKEDLWLLMSPKYTPPRVDGAIEGESLKIVEKTGVAESQSIDGCSGDEHLWWRGAKPGDRLVVEVPVPADGDYHLWMRCVKAPDYGVHRVRVNGKPAIESLDLYDTRVRLSEELDLGVFTAEKGAARVEITITGRNEKAVPSHMFGLDYVRLAPAK